MSASPLGKVTFQALGRDWALKYGFRQRYAAEQAFGCGFIGAFLKVFPGIPAEAILGGDAEAINRVVGVENMAPGALAMLFACGLDGGPDDDTVDELVLDLGFGRVIELITQAIAASMPPVKAGPGEPGKARPAKAA
jgi:hypothetical protein